MRRDPEAVLTAYILDPRRRELFVEGRRDRLFLLWVVGSDRDPNARIAEIDEVDLPGMAEGGRRGRLLAFAARVVDDPSAIRFLADADLSRIRDAAVPRNVWLTDLRDLEGYVFRGECVDKALTLGAGADGVDASELVSNVSRLARRLAALRSLSARTGLKFPFQELDLARYVSVKRANVEVDFDQVLRVLVQNIGLSLSRFDDLMNEWTEEEAALKDVPDNQLIHGKDVMCLLSEVLFSHGVSRKDAPKLVWTSFERRLVGDYPVLVEVVASLSAA